MTRSAISGYLLILGVVLALFGLYKTLSYLTFGICAMSLGVVFMVLGIICMKGDRP